MFIKAFALLFVGVMITLFANAVFQRRRREGDRRKRFVQRLAATNSSRYWEFLEAEYARLRIEDFGLDWLSALQVAHQNRVGYFVEELYYEDKAISDAANSFGIELSTLIKLVGNLLFNYSKLLVAQESYQRRVVGKASIYEGMTLRAHHYYREDCVVEVVQEAFLYDYDVTNGGGNFWVIRVRDIFEPENTEYLSLEDYSVIPLFENGHIYNGKNWLEYLPPETEEEEEEWEEEE